MNLIALPAFSDNYIWVLHNTHQAIVVDPGESAAVINMLKTHHLTLAAILVTHHHPDHINGITALRPYLKGAVYGPLTDLGFSLDGCTHVQEGSHIEFLGLSFKVMAVPGHTPGHVAYHCAALGSDPGVVFCGDALFSAGCGYMFEGLAEDFHRSLQSLSGLPAATKVCCTHEYTLANLRFAAAAEPQNPVRDAHQAWCQARRAQQQSTLPSSMALEHAINPFLRCTEPAVVQAALLHGALNTSPAAVFKALRLWKNRFR
jgi:hydroxyacylglutathione hydrolase